MTKKNCVVWLQKNVHSHPKKGLGNPKRGGGGVLKEKENFNESVKLNWKFQGEGGGEFQTKNLPFGGGG